MIYACRWLLPMTRAPLERGWFEIDRGLIRRLGVGRAPGPAVDLGDTAVLPGLVNAHTHLELSWMAGLVPPTGSMDAWIRDLMRVRRAGAPDLAAERGAISAAIAAMQATGTVLVGDVSNTLASASLLAAAGLGGVLFHELIGFTATKPARLVTGAIARLSEMEGMLPASPVPLRLTIAAHAPYSVSPALFREIAVRAPEGPLAVHLGESLEELQFLASGQGPIRRMLEDLGVWDGDWEPPMSGPVAYLAAVGYLRHGTLAVHGVHLTDSELEWLGRVGATLVTCPRSNLWVGGGMPRVSHFYASGVPVAIGTDSLASVASLNLFDELAELRRIAPDVAAASLLESATRVGASALGFGASHGTIEPGKVAALISVEIPAGVGDVEEYLVSGVPPGAVRRLH